MRQNDCINIFHETLVLLFFNFFPNIEISPVIAIFLYWERNQEYLWRIFMQSFCLTNTNPEIVCMTRIQCEVLTSNLAGKKGVSAHTAVKN